jgi:raffinose/stachyose/melibiose transport system permease protein
MVIMGVTQRRSKAREGPARAGASIVGQKTSRMALAVAPAMILLAAVVVIPTVEGVRLSLTDWGGVGNPNPVGLDNYREILGGSALYSTLWVTFKYAVPSAVLITVLGTVLAATVSTELAGYRFYRVVWFIPGLAPLAAVGVFWTTAFQPTTGLVNTVLGGLGMGSSHAWLAGPSTAIYPVIVATVWASVGFAFLLLLGATESVDVTLYEAARIDGAGRFRQFTSITLPLIRPTIVVTGVLELIWSFNGFALIWAMTQGGPGGATETLPVAVYRDAFLLTKFGEASALAIIGGVVLLVVGSVAMQFSRSAQSAA